VRSPRQLQRLRTHIERFPNGFYRGEANGLLAARRVTEVENWTASQRHLALFQPEAEVPSSDKAATQAVAIHDAQRRVERLCDGFAATTSFRVKSATPAPQEWKCTSAKKGMTCGFEGEAICELDERRFEEVETCGQ